MCSSLGSISSTKLSLRPCVIDLRYGVNMRVNAENEASRVAELTPNVKAVA